MNNCLQFTRGLDTFVESIFLGNVLYDSEIKFRGGYVGMSGFDGIGFLLRAHRRDHSVAVLEENIKDMCGDEARSTLNDVSAGVFDRETKGSD